MKRTTDDDFDPYRKWLGVRSGRGKPTHYEILGLDLDEDDPETIEGAAARRTAFVEGQLGLGRDKLVAAIKYEIAEARATLRDPELRREYDRRLKLFLKRRRKRRVDPTVPARGFDSPPPRTVGGSRAVGEGPDFLRSYAGVMAVLTVSFGAMAWWAFRLPWANPPKVADADRGNALFEAIEADGSVPASASDVSGASATKAGVVTTAAVEPAAAKSPPADALTFNGKRYKFFRGPVSWTEAKRRCEAMGGRLPVVTNLSEHSFLVRSALAEFGVGAMPTNGLWLDASDAASEGVWRTSAGEPLPFTRWGKSQPNNKGGGEDYAMLWLKGSDWSDQPDVSLQHTVHYVCEWPGEGGSPPVETGEPQPGEWTELLSGDLSDRWRVWKDSGPMETWRLRDGVLAPPLIRDHAVRPTIATRRKYGDFELEFEYVSEREATTGLCFRVPPWSHDKPYTFAPTIQIGHRHDLVNKWGWTHESGALLRFRRVPKAMQVAPSMTDWHAIRLRMVGDDGTVWLDGEEAYTFRIGTESWNRQVEKIDWLDSRYATAKSGPIAIYPEIGNVRLRNMRIRSLVAIGSEDRPEPTAAQRRLEQQLIGTRWRNERGVYFEFLTGGHVRHGRDTGNLARYSWRPLDGGSVEFVFDDAHKDTIDFAVDFETFTQHPWGDRSTGFEGRRVTW